ncbi:MAG TPA: ABC transporter ATP-binding protein [Jiangellales bacterium]|nr:ABC transporter ATP-binding protein [Jiangellales bacterium]
MTREALSVHCSGLVHLYRGSDGSDVVALRGVDLDVAAGERMALLGPSGSGKSTLLELLAGLQRASAGRLHVGGHDLRAMTPAELTRFRAGRVGTVLQGAARNLFPYATAEQNVAFAQRSLGRRARRRLLRPAELLEALGLGSVARRRVGLLSGGEQQRVAVAVGLANGPGLLLADEPTSQLDAAHRRHVLDLLTRAGDELGTTVVVVTHDADVGQALGRTVSMRDGRVGAEGRHGVEYAVVGRDGSVLIPDPLLTDWPPGTLVRVEEDGDGLRLTREDDP